MVVPDAVPDSTLRRKQGRRVLVVDGKVECIDCSLWLPLSDFYADKKSRTGVQSYCKQCLSDRVLLSRMGLTRAEYNTILESQEFVCAICKSPEIVRKYGGVVSALAVDHDHACCPGRKACSKCRRGLLCQSCNVALGAIERVGSVDPFAAYLARHAMPMVSPPNGNVSG